MKSNLEWTERESSMKLVNFRAEPEWIERLSGICKENSISKADFIRLAVSQMMSRMSV